MSLYGFDHGARLVREFLRRVNIDAVRGTNAKCAFTVDVQSTPCPASVKIEYGACPCPRVARLGGVEKNRKKELF